MKAKIYLLNIVTILMSCNFSQFSTNELPGFNFDNFKNTPVKDLAIAARNNNIDKIETILKNNNVEIDYAETKFNNNILLCAVVNNKLAATEKLIQLGANVNYKTKDEDSLNAILACCLYNESNDTSMLSLLLRYGVDINSIITSTKDYKLENTPLLALITSSVIGKNMLKIKYLVNKGANVNISLNGEINNLIRKSIELDRLDILKFLFLNSKIEIPKFYGYIYRETNHPRKLTIIEALYSNDYVKGSKNDKLRTEIIDFLKSKGQNN